MSMRTSVFIPHLAALGCLTGLLASASPARAWSDTDGRVGHYYTRRTLTVPFASAIPLVGKFNNDTVDDILWFTPGTPASGANDAFWYGSAGQPGVFTTVNLPAGEYDMIADPAAGDFDGNGQTDIYWYEQNDARAQDALWMRANATWTKGWLDSFVDGGTPYVGDFNGDGLDDVLVHYGTFFGGDGVAAVRWGSRTVPLQRWSYVYSAADGAAATTHPGASLGVGDFDGDGRDDVRLFRPKLNNDFDGFSNDWYFRADEKVDIAAIGLQAGKQSFARAAAGDADGNGGDDLLVHNPTTGAVDTLFSISRAASAYNANPATLSPGTYRPVRGDFDANGRLDVLWYGVGSARDELWATRAPFRLTRDVVFKTGVPRSGGSNRLLLDIARPPSSVAGPYKTIVYVHGGGWFSKPRDQRIAPAGMAALLRAGYAIVSVDYRGTNDRGANLQQWVAPGTVPALGDMVKDIKYAIAWLRRYGGSYGLNTTKIAVAGGSAGGHLALMAGLSNDSAALQPTLPADLAGTNPYNATRVHGVIPMAGPTVAENGWTGNTTLTYDLLYDYSVATALGCSPSSQPYTFRADPAVTVPPCHVLVKIAFSPLFQIDASDPPVLLGYNTDDTVVIKKHGDDLWTALTGTAGRTGLDVYPQGLTGAHAGIHFPESTLLTFVARALN